MLRRPKGGLMPLSNDQLRSIPLLAGLNDDQCKAISELFEHVNLSAGTTLCIAGAVASEFYILESGSVKLSDGDRVDFEVKPPAPIGELGALGGIHRNVNVTASTDSIVWRVSREALAKFLRTHADIGMIVYQNLTAVVADKVHRDQLRLQDMRENLIATQKKMKALREFVLEAEETPLSEKVHDDLNDLIEHNRRINYRVAPPAPLPVHVRDDSVGDLPVEELSRTHFSFVVDADRVPEQSSRIDGVLALAGPEIPFSGRVIRVNEERVTVELDPFIDEYAVKLEGYLSRVQMVDFVV